MKTTLKKAKSNLGIDRSPLSATEKELVDIIKKKKLAAESKKKSA